MKLVNLSMVCCLLLLELCITCAYLARVSMHAACVFQRASGRPCCVHAACVLCACCVCAVCTLHTCFHACCVCLSASEWAPVLTSLRVPELSEDAFLRTAIATGSFLTLFVHLLQRMASSRSLEEERDLLVRLLTWSRHAQPT